MKRLMQLIECRLLRWHGEEYSQLQGMHEGLIRTVWFRSCPTCGKLLKARKNWGLLLCKIRWHNRAWRDMAKDGEMYRVVFCGCCGKPLKP